MWVTKTNSEESDGIILDSDNYEGGIKHIEISYERTRTPDEPSTEDEETISRAELGKLMWVARIASPGAIYDSSAAALTFSGGELFDVLERCGEILGKGKRKFLEMESKWPRTHAWFCQISGIATKGC